VRRGYDPLPRRRRHNRWTALGIRTDIPHPARVYDFILGGKDNVPDPGADRAWTYCGVARV
jgi:hypothetical protein